MSESSTIPEPEPNSSNPWAEAITLPPEPRLPSWSVFGSIWTPSWRDPPMPCLIDAWSWYGEESIIYRSTK